MQFSTTFNAILALAIGSNAASINVRQSEPMTASINIYNTPDCTDLPQHGIELLSADIGKCGSYEWSLKGVMPYIFNGSCKCKLSIAPHNNRPAQEYNY